MTAPFVLTVPAPVSGQTMCVGAFAYTSGGTESARTNITIPGGITVATSSGDLNLMPGSGITVDTTTTAGSVIVTATSGTSMAPTLIPVGETFVVPENKQALFKLPIRVLGDLVVRGDLVQV